MRQIPKTAPKTAMVLAAGLGTRMRPLTDDRPKALVEVGGQALIDHMIDRLVAVGVERFVVNVHYFADRLEDHLSKRAETIIVSDERALLLETGGGLKKARPLLGHDPVWVANIDSVWIADDESGPHNLTRLVNQFDPEHMEASLLLADRVRSHGFEEAGDFYRAQDGQLAFRNDRPSAPFAFMGVHITKPQIVDAGPEGEAFSLSPIWRKLASQGRLYGDILSGEWFHVGDPEAVTLTEARLRG